jgi:hypothetical protein
MRGYREVFDAAEREAQALTEEKYEEALKNWRTHPELFHFTMAGHANAQEPDAEALKLASVLNSELTSRMLGKGPLKSTQSRVDVVESRHILMMVFLASIVGTNWGTVLEIGGGYGNCVRLIQELVEYDEWNIVDLPHVLGLQKYVHTLLEIPKVSYHRSVPAGTPKIVLATHSLSEFDKETFDYYFENISNAKYILYAAHISQPSVESLMYQREKLMTQFHVLRFQPYENGHSELRLLINRD